MPAWQGNIADTIRFLLGEGAPQDEAIAAAYELAAQNGATSLADMVPLTALSRRAHVAQLSDPALAVACCRISEIRKSTGRAKLSKLELYMQAEAKRRWSQKWKGDHGGPNPGVMLAAMIPAELAKSIAIPDGETPDGLHCTIAYLGRMGEIGPDGLAKARAAIAKISASTPALRGRLGGLGRFAASESSDGLDVIYAAMDLPGLAEFRNACVSALEAAGVPVRKDHDFNPHVTLAYVGTSDPTPEMSDALRNAPLMVDGIALVAGDSVADSFPLAPPAADLKLKSRIFRSAPEQRYTLSVAYPVAEFDAHKNFANAEALERAAWDYMRSSRQVGLMHDRGTAKGATTGSGELVESYIYRGPDWKIADQVVTNGDWLAGIIWSPEAWEYVKMPGGMSGLSFQGMSAIDKQSLKPTPPAPAAPAQLALPATASRQ